MSYEQAYYRLYDDHEKLRAENERLKLEIFDLNEAHAWKLQEKEQENKWMRDLLKDLLAELERNGHGEPAPDPDCWVCREMKKSYAALEGKENGDLRTKENLL